MQTLIVQLEDATQSLPGLITESSVLDTLEGWDSLGLVAFINIVAEQSAVELSMDELKECATVADIGYLLNRKAAECTAS